jgi:hypothetical protein
VTPFVQSVNFESKSAAIVASNMSVEQVTLVVGIVGGFVPATPSLVVRIKDDQVDASENQGPVTHARLSPQTRLRLLSELKAVRSLPLEKPPGSADIYGLNTSLSVRFSDGSTWTNSAPTGCVHGVSISIPTEAQSETFARLVQMVKDAASEASRV